jgi:hypothetical protein
MQTSSRFVPLTATGFLAVLLLATSTFAKDEMPDVTSDGLPRIDSKKVDAVYWQPGATLEAYTEVKILDAPVAFRKNWMRDHNSSASRSLDSRVSQSDMDRIKEQLGEAFKEEFSKTLEKAGYKVVDEVGENVLLLRPAIVNLDVAAPDLRNSTGMNRTYTADAGSMTLYMELYDSATSAKIGEIVDSQGAMDTGQMRFSNRVTNKAEADRILRKWAGILVEALDEAHGK